MAFREKEERVKEKEKGIKEKNEGAEIGTVKGQCGGTDESQSIETIESRNFASGDGRRKTAKRKIKKCCGKVQRSLRKKWKWILTLLAALVIALAVCVSYFSGRTQQHYELSEELRVKFSNADEIIAAMRKALSRHDYRIYIKYQAQDGYMDDVPPLVDELMDYAMAETDDPAQGDYIRYQTGGYDLDWRNDEGENDWTYTLMITPIYYTKPAQEDTVDADIQSILSGFHFYPWTSDEEKVRTIHDYICTHVKYDAIHQSSQYHLKSTAYAALERGTAACQGYSVLFYRLARESGLNCRVVTGIGEYEGKSEFHAWNIVELNGLYYNVDTTWDSRLESDEYYLRGGADFSGHTRSEKFQTQEFLDEYPMAQEDFSTGATK